MRILPFLLLLLISLPLLHAEFVLRELDVTVSDIQKDGSVHVQEDIRFMVVGDYAKALYESGFDVNDLAFWANATQIKEIRLHLNPSRVNIPPSEFALRPQPLRNCNAALDLCQGELLVNYNAYPYYNQSLAGPIPGTGLFRVESPKPRTRRYILNPEALAFTPTARGDLRLEQGIYLTLHLPPGALVESESGLNPKPNDLESAVFPLSTRTLQWTNLVLVKFNVLFLVEDTLDKEVVGLFSDTFQALERQVLGGQGVAILLIVLIVLGGYLYLQQAKGRKVP